MTWHNCLHTRDGYYACNIADNNLLIIKPLVCHTDSYYFDIAHIFVTYIIILLSYLCTQFPKKKKHFN